MDKTSRSTAESSTAPSKPSRADLRLARQARILGACLIARSEALAAGKGDQAITSSGSGRPFTIKVGSHESPCTIQQYLLQILKACNEAPISKELQKQQIATFVLELKANLLACFTYCQRLYNGWKPPSRPKRTSSEESEARHLSAKVVTKKQVQAAFDRLLPAAIPYPLTKDIMEVARGELATVLRDRGERGRQRPLEATYPVIQMVLKWYFGVSVTVDQIRQGASVQLKQPRRRPTKPAPGPESKEQRLTRDILGLSVISPELIHALVQEFSDPDHKVRDLVNKNILRTQEKLHTESTDGKLGGWLTSEDADP